MKSLIFKISILLVSLNTYSQSWNGIPISGSINTMETNLLKKGFTLTKKEANVSIFVGSINLVKYELIVVSTPLTKQVAKLVIFFPQKISWLSIKSEYEDLKNMLSEKYGNGTSFSYFDKPYYEGDGYEMTAVEIEKCHYSCYWIDIYQEPNMSVSLQISSYKQVQIDYENKANMKKNIEEKDTLNKKIF